MPYITSFERDAKLEIARESVIEVLETRLSVVPASLIAKVNGIEDLPRLKQLLKRAATIASVEEFEQVLAQADS